MAIDALGMIYDRRNKELLNGIVAGALFVAE